MPYLIYPAIKRGSRECCGVKAFYEKIKRDIGVNNFDTTILTFLTNITFSSALANHAIRVVAGLYTFKGFVLVPILWWMWFQPDHRSERTRETIIATIASALLALALGRLLAHWLPFRVRPVYNADLPLHFPVAGLRDAGLESWSSFPSDHAMLWMSVATGIFFVSRFVGVLSIVYTAIFICLPRVYLGYHYPTDILAGAAIGVAITWALTRDPVRRRIAGPILHWARRSPGPVYMLAFLLCFELITQFDDLLRLVHSTAKVL